MGSQISENKYIVTARMTYCSKKPNLLSMNIKPADNTKAVLPTINSLLFFKYIEYIFLYEKVERQIQVYN